MSILPFINRLQAMEMEIDMKKVWASVKVVLCICAVSGWWGVLYPELVLTADTYRIYSDSEQDEQDMQDGQPLSVDQDIYWKLLEADRKEIRFKSRLLVEWNKFMEALNESDQNRAAP